MSWLGGHLPESPSFASTCSGFIADNDKAGLAKALVSVVPQLLSSQSLTASALTTPLTYLSHLIVTSAPNLADSYLKALETSPHGLASMATFYNFLTDSQKVRGCSRALGYTDVLNATSDVRRNVQETNVDIS